MMVTEAKQGLLYVNKENDHEMVVLALGGGNVLKCGGVHIKGTVVRNTDETSALVVGVYSDTWNGCVFELYDGIVAFNNKEQLTAVSAEDLNGDAFADDPEFALKE